MCADGDLRGLVIPGTMTDAKHLAALAFWIVGFRGNIGLFSNGGATFTNKGLITYELFYTPRTLVADGEDSSREWEYGEELDSKVATAGKDGRLSVKGRRNYLVAGISNGVAVSQGTAAMLFRRHFSGYPEPEEVRFFSGKGIVCAWARRGSGPQGLYIKSSGRAAMRAALPQNCDNLLVEGRWIAAKCGRSLVLVNAQTQEVRRINDVDYIGSTEGGEPIWGRSSGSDYTDPAAKTAVYSVDGKQIATFPGWFDVRMYKNPTEAIGIIEVRRHQGNPVCEMIGGSRMTLCENAEEIEPRSLEFAWRSLFR